MRAAKSIGNQIIALVALSILLLGGMIIGVLSVQTYKDMENLLADRNEIASRMFRIELEAELLQFNQALQAFSAQKDIEDRIAQLTRNGPLYSEDGPDFVRDIDDAEASFYLLSQLHLVEAVLGVQKQYGFSRLVLLQTQPFLEIEQSNILPSIVIQDDQIFLYRYYQKHFKSESSIYQFPLASFDDWQKLFNVSSIYQHEPDYFYSLLKAEEINALVGIPEINLVKNDSSGKLFVEQNDAFYSIVWSPFVTELEDPADFSIGEATSAMIIGSHLTEESDLFRISNTIGAEVAILSNDRIISASQPFESATKSDDYYNYNRIPYLYTLNKLTNVYLESDIYAVSLLSTEKLRSNSRKEIFTIIIMVMSFVLMIEIAVIFLIRQNLNSPLEKLLDGVQRVIDGDLSTPVIMRSENEFSVVADAFNEMRYRVKSSSEGLSLANETLEQKVKDRTLELIEAQQQLILSEKMASLGQLVSGVAHEINTPLGNAITALSFSDQLIGELKQNLADKKLSAHYLNDLVIQSTESFGIIQRSLERTSEIINSFKKVAVSQTVEELHTFSLFEHVQDILIALKPRLEAEKVNIELDVRKDIRITNYTGAIYNIVSNLILNSIIHGFKGSGGFIQMTASKVGKELEIYYQDDGVGMDENVVSKIFEPFFTTIRGSGGTGLGMYMTYNIVTQRLGGKIEIKSDIDKGMHCIIRIPLIVKHVNTSPDTLF